MLRRVYVPGVIINVGKCELSVDYFETTYCVASLHRIDRM